MFYLFALFIQLALAAVVLYFSFFVGLFVLFGASAVGGAVTLSAFVTSGMRGYRGDAPLDGLRIEPPEPDSGLEPAYRSYYFGPVARDFSIVVRESGLAAYTRLREWIIWIRGNWLGRSSSVYWRVPLFLPTVGAVVGLVAGGVIGAALLACVAVVDGVLLGVLIGLGLLVGTVFRVIELGVLWVRGITLECPNCHERLTRPIYRCSGEGGCGAAHAALVPGSLGIFYRVCRCGRSLATLLLLGKWDLDAQCSHCKLMLPAKGFSAPTLHIPVAGGPQVGKSVFMFAAVKRLHEEAGGDQSKTPFWADRSFAAEFISKSDSIANPDLMLKTTATRPKAYNIYLGNGMSRRLVYLYDTAGEIYDDSGALAQAGFYTFTKGIAICIDPFSLAGLRRRVDRSTLDRVRSLPSDPKATIERLTENLRETMKVNGSRKLGVKVAVILTKADALGSAMVKHPYAGMKSGTGAPPSRAERDSAVRAWIGDVGVRADLVSSIANNFETSSFFVVSHADALAKGRAASRGVNDDPADPVQWLVDGGSVR